MGQWCVGGGSEVGWWWVGDGSEVDPWWVGGGTVGGGPCRELKEAG